MAAVPAIALLGLAASLLEGVGIGLLIPLLSLLIPGSLPPQPVGVLRSVSENLGAYGTDGQVIALASAIIALVVVKCLVQVANACFAAKVDNRIADDIRKALADRLLTLDYRFFVENDANRLARVVTTDSWFVAEAVRAGIALLPATTAILVFGSLLAWLNLTLFAVVVGGSAAMHGLLQLLEKRQSELGDAITAADQDYWGRTWTLAYAGRVIRLFGQAGRERGKFAEARAEFTRAQMAARYHAATIAPFVEILLMILFVTTVVVGFWTGMSPPALAAFLLLLLRLQPSISAVRNARVAIASAHGAQTEVEWLLRQRAAPEPAAHRRSTVKIDAPIVFDAVSFTYPNGTPGVRNVSLTIRPGITTALIGPSGSGKTTIVNLLCRLLEPSSGSITVEDLPVEQIDREAWLSRIGVAGQDLELIDGTVAENIAYGAPGASMAEIEGVARVARAATFIEQLPLGYATQVGQSGRHLSGGERQRIALARALLRKPDLLILDEATSAVDALTEIETIRILSGHRFFRTALVISHRKSTLSACEDGIVMHDGQVIEAGRLNELSYFQDMVGAAEAAA